MSNLLGRFEDPVTKGSIAARVIRDAILNGLFPPGTQLKLTMLAEELNMSYTPLREALQILSSEGLIESRPHASAVVVGLDVGRAQEIYRLRLVLEPYAARMACEAATYDNITELIHTNDKMVEAIQEDRHDLIPSLNRQFHMALYSRADSPLLLEFIQKLWNGVPFQVISLSDRASESVKGHELILDALRARDPDAAEHHTREHIDSGAQAAMKYMSEFSRNATGE